MKKPVTRLIEIDDYISNHEEALKEHITFDKPKFIIKGDTGLGGTTSIIEKATCGVILIEPLQSIIKAKKASYKPVEGRRVSFALEGEKGRSKPLQELMADPSQPFVYVCTADLLMTLIDNHQIDVEQLVNIPLFVDEVHIALTASSYRTNLPRFLDIVYNYWKANFILASATYVEGHIDIPLEVRKKLDYIRVRRKEAKAKDFYVMPDKPDIYLTAVEKNFKKGEKTVVFTNHAVTINRFIQTFGEDNVQVMVGKKLLPQMARLKQLEELEYDPKKSGQVDPDKLIFLLSSAFDTGFDFLYDAHVMVFAREKNDVDSRTYLDMIQAFGRVRGEKLSQSLVINTSKPDIEIPKIEYDLPNYCEVKFEEIREAVRQSTYNLGYLTRVLHEYGYIVETDKEFATQTFLNRAYKSSSPKEKITKLLNQNFDVLAKLFSTEKSRIALSGQVGSSFRFVTEYAVAYSLYYFKGNEYIDSIINDVHELKPASVRLERIVQKLFYFYYINNDDLKAAINDCYLPSEKQMTQAINKGAELTGEIELSRSYFNQSNTESLDLAAMHIISYAYCFNEIKKIGLPEPSHFQLEMDELKSDVKREITKQLEPFGEVTPDSLFRYRSNITPTNLKNQVAKARKKSRLHELKLKEVISNLKKGESPKLMWYLWTELELSAKQKHKLFKNHHVFVLSKLIGASDVGFGVNHIDFREYNPSTKCPRYLRYQKSPYKLVEYDLRSANAQYVDSILGADIAFYVYDSIMKAEGCTRELAKVMYNSALNSICMGKSKKIKFFTESCGYTNEQANRLVDITSRTGSDKFYYSATRFEEKMVDEFTMNNWLDGAWVRVHDAIIIPQYQPKEITYGLDRFGVTEH